MRPSVQEKETPACSRNEGYVIGRLAVAGRAAARPGGRAPQRSFLSGGLPVDPARSATPGPRRDADRSPNPMRLVPSARPPRGAAVQRFARTVPKLGTAQYERIRFKCVWRHRTRRQYGQRTGDIHLGRRRSALT